MFASNFTILDASLKYVRGQDKIKTFAMTKTIATGNTMTNYFCSVCGSLMYRVSSGWPGKAIMRIGQVDDRTLHETTLKPQLETFTKDRVAWFKGAEGAEQYHGNYYGGETEKSKI
ncbi:hypothetical protein MMC12_005381 [Toensbergia leucococca]|nr:hypothetical protein [Toensbergia leucococca]